MRKYKSILIELLFIVIYTGILIIPMIKDLGTLQKEYTLEYDHILICLLLIGFYLILGINIGKEIERIKK